jgi:hypothetical protein
MSTLYVGRYNTMPSIERNVLPRIGYVIKFEVLKRHKDISKDPASVAMNNWCVYEYTNTEALVDIR